VLEEENEAMESKKIKLKWYFHFFFGCRRNRGGAGRNRKEESTTFKC